MGNRQLKSSSPTKEVRAKPQSKQASSKLMDDAILEKSVSEFLLKNPMFLDKFVQEHLSVYRLQRWRKDLVSRSDVDIKASIDEYATTFEDNIQLGHARTIVKSLFFPNKAADSDAEQLILTSDLFQPDRIQSYLFPFSEISSSKANLKFMYMIEDLFGPKAFPEYQFRNFLKRVQANYYKVPFHNYKHAIGHAQSMYWAFKQSHTPYFSETEKKILMIASLTHDLGHPGFSDLLMHKNYPFAYNILFMEKSHSQLLFLILLDNDCDIFSDISDPELSEVILDLKSCILTPHFSSCNDVLKYFQKVFKDAKDSNREIFKYAIMQLLMVTCELSETWKLWSIHKETMTALHTEISNRAKKVQILDEDTTEVLFDKILTSLEEFAVNFLSKFAIPFLEISCKVIPCFEKPLDQANKNLQQWYRVLKNGY